MPHDLSYRQEKIQEKRKLTSFRDYLKEIASRYPSMFYRREGIVSRYPDTLRCTKILNAIEFFDYAPTQTLEKTEGNFFEEMQILRNILPMPNLVNRWLTENAEYADTVRMAKNAYLWFVIAIDVENILYTHNAKDGATNVYNGLMIWNVSQNIYTAKGILNSSNIFYSVYIDNCYDVWFSRNLTGCQKCIFCDNLENKSYCIHNVQYSKESFEQQKATILADKSHFEERYSAVCQSDEVDGYYVASQNVSGDFIYHSEDVENGYFVSNVKGGRNLVMVGGDGHSEHCYDLFSGGNGINNYLCGSTFVGGKGSSNVYCCSHINTGNNMYYSYLCLECSYCLGCIGLKNKSYCIFNKQYTKEERHEKVDEIFTQMEKDWTLWQFFPATMNPFYFNDTAAYLIDPTFTKEEVEAAGYLRRNEPIKVDIPSDLERLDVQDLDQYEGYDAEGKRHINPDILKKVIIDEAGNARRIVGMEYKFLEKYGLPLPRKHRLERMKENFRIG